MLLNLTGLKDLSGLEVRSLSTAGTQGQQPSYKTILSLSFGAIIWHTSNLRQFSRQILLIYAKTSSQVDAD